MIRRDPNSPNPMRIRHCLFVTLLLLAACSKGDDALAGHWKVEAPVDGLQVGVDFDGKGGQVIAHLDGPDGHVHPPKGSYSFDATTKTVSVRCALLGEGKPDSWSGTLAGDVLELAAGERKLRLKKGGSAH
jgi:hypothetical protein